MHCRILCHVLGLQFDDPCTGKLLVRLILFEHRPLSGYVSCSFSLSCSCSSSLACSKQASNISSFLPSAWSSRLSVLRLVTHTHTHSQHNRYSTHMVRPQLRWRSSSPSPSSSRSPSRSRSRSRRRCLCAGSLSSLLCLSMIYMPLTGCITATGCSREADPAPGSILSQFTPQFLSLRFVNPSAFSAELRCPRDNVRLAALVAAADLHRCICVCVCVGVCVPSCIIQLLSTD